MDIAPLNQKTGYYRWMKSSGLSNALLESLEVKGAGLRLSQFEMSGNALVGHFNKKPI